MESGRKSSYPLDVRCSYKLIFKINNLNKENQLS